MPVNSAAFWKHIRCVPARIFKISDTFPIDRAHPPLFEYTENGICFWEEGIIELATIGKPQIINNQIKSQTLDGAWELFFPKGWGAPERKIFPKLMFLDRF
jgi:hypothetical protein